MSRVNEAASMYKQLKSNWDTTHPNLGKCEELLEGLKLELTHFKFLPTVTAVVDKKELMLARDILEIGVQWSIAAKNLPSFERYMAQLKCYYFDYKKQLPDSPLTYQLLGLNLLFLLSQNRVAEFHTEMELLPGDIIQDNKYTRHPLSIEQYLMEGSYNKIFQAKDDVPAKNYNFFMDILLDTVRNEIAVCLEKAYEKISPTNATRMLYLKPEEDIHEFAAKRKWKLEKDGFFRFAPIVKQSDDTIPSAKLANQAINYARELEKIV